MQFNAQQKNIKYELLLDILIKYEYFTLTSTHQTGDGMTAQSKIIDELKAELEAAREVAKAAHEAPWEACTTRWEADEAIEGLRP